MLGRLGNIILFFFKCVIFILSELLHKIYFLREIKKKNNTRFLHAIEHNYLFFFSYQSKEIIFCFRHQLENAPI